MAVDLYAENSNMSPRISFSRDFCQFDAIPIEQRPLRSSRLSSLNSSVDFDFGVAGGEIFQDSWSADEIFSGGKILPTEIKKRVEPENRGGGSTSGGGNPEARKTQSASRQSRKTKQRSENQRKGTKGGDETGEENEERGSATRSFWGFKRSSSLNCGSGYARSLCPLPLLSRSNSTGSAPSSIAKPPKQSSTKKPEASRVFQSCSLGSYQKPPLKKTHGAYGNGIRVNPVLNVVSGNLFGLGSMLSGSGRDKSRRP